MKQRILSLVLAVLMIVSAVPVLVLSIGADEAVNDGTYVTKLSKDENWPQAVTDDGKEYYPVYSGNWTMGTMDAGLYYEFAGVYLEKGVPEAFNKDGAGTWGAKGTAVYMGTGEAALLGASSKEVPGTNGPGSYYSPLNDEANTMAVVYTYTSRYEGVVDISMEDVAAISKDYDAEKEPTLAEGEIYQAYFAVLVNGEMVWPVAGGSVTNIADLALYPQKEGVDEDGDDVLTKVIAPDALKNYSVNCGDKIQFVVARYNCRYAKFVPTVAFQAGYKVAPTTLAETFIPSSDNWPVAPNLNAALLWDQCDPYWELGNYTLADGAFAPYANVHRQATRSWVSGASKSDFTRYNGILVANGAFLFGSEDTTTAPAYQYTALATGTVDLTTNIVKLLDANNNPAKNASATLIYVVNGEKKAEVPVTSDASGVVTVDTLPTGITIVKGDIVTIAAKAGTGATSMLATPVVQYTAIDSFIAAPSTGEQYAMSMEKESVIVGDKIAIRIAAFATRDVYQHAGDDGVILRVWSADVEEKTADNATEITMTLRIEDGYAYVCEYDQFAPKQMTDIITVQTVVDVDGTIVFETEKKEISLEDVAYAQYQDAVADADEAMQKTMVAVLNYGAAAQKYFAYNTDNLANKNLPADLQVVEQKPDGYYSSANMDTVTPEDRQCCSSEIVSASLIFESTISIRVYVNVAQDEVGLPTAIYHTTVKDELYDSKTKGADMDDANSFVLTNIGLDDLSKTQYFQVRVKHNRELAAGIVMPVTFYGNELSYSVESYVARMAYETDKPELAELLHALMNLSACVVEEA